MTKTGRLFVVSGPSGSGKSTLCRALVEATDAKLSVSATTRPRSQTEVDGENYYFLSQEEFQRKIQKGELLEYAQVFSHYYGTPVEPVRRMLAQGQTVLLEIDVQGARQVFERFPGATGILVLPPNEDELRRRLHDRGRDKSEAIDQRLAKAQWEIEQAQAEGRYKHTVINDDLDRALAEMVAVIAAPTR